MYDSLFDLYQRNVLIKSAEELGRLDEYSEKTREALEGNNQEARSRLLSLEYDLLWYAFLALRQVASEKDLALRGILQRGERGAESHG